MNHRDREIECPKMGLGSFGIPWCSAVWAGRRAGRGGRIGVEFGAIMAFWGANLARGHIVAGGFAGKAGWGFVYKELGAVTGFMEARYSVAYGHG